MSHMFPLYTEVVLCHLVLLQDKFKYPYLCFFHLSPLSASLSSVFVSYSPPFVSLGQINLHCAENLVWECLVPNTGSFTIVEWF